MKNSMDELLRLSLAPTEEPTGLLNRQVLRQTEREEQTMKKREDKRKGGQADRRLIPAAAIGLCAVFLASVTVYAAYRYLSPSQAAEALFADHALAQAFQGEGAVLVNETQISGGYRITLLGSAAGRNISDYLYRHNGEVVEDRIYTVVAIERADGTPMPDTSSDAYGEESFFVSHYVRGLDPKSYNAVSMGGGYGEFVQDGVMYRILETDNVEMFADRGIYVGVNSGTFYDVNAYRYDEETGEMTQNEDYDGANALFLLPLDPAKADPEAAAAYLERWEKKMSGEDETAETSVPEAPTDADVFMERLTPENLDEYAAPAEYTRMVCTPDANGMISYGYRMESGAGSENQQARVDWLFPEDRESDVLIGGWSHSGSLDTLNIEVFTLHEDGTVEFVIYQPK